MQSAKRQAAISKLLEKGQVSSQKELGRQLAKLGLRVTQATISRDLEELGAVRVRRGRRFYYELLAGVSGFGMSLEMVLKEFVISRAASGSMAVLKTPPGHANMVASAVDRAALPGILGTVAGDDTVFICGDEKLQGKGALRLLKY